MKVTLQKMTKEHSGLIVQWRNADKEFFGDGQGKDLTVSDQIWWYNNRYLTDPADHYYLVYADGQPVGTISFNSATAEIGRVLLGYKKLEGKGVMSRALTQLMCTYRLHYYWLRVRKDNERAIEFYRRNKFWVRGKSLSSPGMIIMERNFA